MLFAAVVLRKVMNKMMMSYAYKEELVSLEGV
jgi:hypothetical protein